MKKYFKSLFIFLLSFVLAISISSCGNSRNEIKEEIVPLDTGLCNLESDFAYIEECPTNFKFIINSDTTITVEDIYDHVIVVDCYNEMRVLGLVNYKDYYVILSQEEYIPGELYTIILADDTTVIGYIDSQEVLINNGDGFSQKEVSFSIKKENVINFEYNEDNVKILTINNILEETEEYIVVKDCPYKVGNVLAVTNESGNIEEDTQFIKALDIVEVQGGFKITYDFPKVEDIYKELDVYVEEEFDYSKIDLNQIDTSNIEEDIKKTETYRRFILAAKCLNKSEPLKALSDSIKVKFEISKSDKGVSAKITLSYEYGNFKIELIFEPTLKIDIKAQAKLDLKLLVWKSRLNMDFCLTTTLTMPITLKLSYDNNSDSDLKTKIIDALKDSSRDKDVCDALETGTSVSNNEISIDIFETPQYQIPYTPLGISIDIDFIINLEIKAELSATVTYTNKTIVGVKTTSSGLTRYGSEEKNIIFNDIIIQGKIEVQGGIRVSAKLGLLGLSKYVNVSLSFDVGAYVLLAGKITIHSDDGTIGGYKLKDAVYCFEVGLFMRVSIGYKLFVFDDRITLAMIRIPIYHIGNELYETKLLGNETLEMKTKLASVTSTLNMKVKTVNLLTGEITTPFPNNDDLSYEFENGEYIKVKNGFFVIQPGAPEVVKDKVTITYKNDPELQLVVNIQYINEGALDGLYPDESGAIYDLDRNTHTYTLIEVPSNVEEYSILEEVSSLPVVAIDTNAFYNCNKLTNVIIPNTVKSIGDQAFYGCKKITNIDISNVDTLGEGVFKGCTSLNKVNLSSKIIKIPSYTFYGCKSLSTINIENIEEFGSYSFYDCDSIKSVTLDRDTIFNGSSFSNCSNLLCINTNSNKAIFNNNPFFNSNDNLLIAVDKNEINNYMNEYSNYKRSFTDSSLIFNDYILKEIDDGYEIKLYIGNSCEVSVPESISGHKITSIGGKSFNMINSIVLPSTITNISSNAFYGCESLKEVHILNEEKVIEVGSASFWGANSKLKIYVPNNLKELYIKNAKWAFYNGQIESEK